MIYGALLVKACAANGVHYLDLTGKLIRGLPVRPCGIVDNRCPPSYLTGETSFSAAMIRDHARTALSTYVTSLGL